MLTANPFSLVALWTLVRLLATSAVVGSVALGQADDTSWYQYVRAPSSTTVSPQGIIAQNTTGDVENPEGLIQGDSPTVLSRSSTSGDAPSLIVDFGQNVVGLLTIDFAGATNGSTGYPGIVLAFSETLEFLTNKSDFTRSYNAAGGDQAIVPSWTDQIAVKPDPYTWIDQFGCEYGSQVCSDGLHGFRYVRITLDSLSSDAPYTSSEGNVSISSVELQFVGFLGTPDTFTGWFECSDENLTQWWFDGAYTNEMVTATFLGNDTEPRNADSPSIEGKLVLQDGAKRDRDPYVGDLAVSALTAFLTHDVQEAARNVMEDLIQHQSTDGWIPPASINDYQLQLFDYPLWWVSCAWDYVYYTGNVSYIEAYYANLQLVLNNYYPSNTDNTTSLLVRPDGFGDFAFITRPGSAGYYSALYVLALNRAADLAGLVSGAENDAQTWRERAIAVSAGFVSQLWDASVGAFLDRNCTGAGCDAHAQDGNSLAVLAGVVAANSSEAAASLAYLSSANAYEYGNAFYDAGGNDITGCDGCSERVYAFISYFEMAARFEAGLASSALDQIRRTYGWMAAREPGGTFWEGIGADGTPYEGAYTSMAHGWSTGVVPLLSGYVLGVRPVGPGFAEWAVKPVVVADDDSDISWARGAVPTPSGPIQVSWVLDADTGALNISVDAPSGTSGTVSVPYNATAASGGDQAAQVLLDGQVVWTSTGSVEVSTATAADGYVSVQLEGGANHTVAYQNI
ncbi:glycoside hydrolase family 78 protein [Xylariales sp. PMI_506]|nr:glycoside hydrolase family 78 protein [Xylariales sp. PMI_506]